MRFSQKSPPNDELIATLNGRKASRRIREDGWIWAPLTPPRLQTALLV